MNGRRSELRMVTLHVDQRMIAAYAEITGDFNPIHVDPDFAATTEMGGVIAHGTLSLNLIWQALEKSLGRESACRMTLDVRFRHPVRVGDTIDAGGALREGGTTYDVWARNQNGVTIIEGTASSL